MKRSSVVIAVGVVGMLLYACNPQKQNLPSLNGDMDKLVKDGIMWNGKNEFANYLSAKARWHMMNIEFEKAYVLFEEAVHLDSTLFASHVALGFFSKGDKKNFHLNMAKKFSADKNETSKLFVSLLESPDDSVGQEKNREIWAKMHELSNGPFIHFYYVLTRKDSIERMTELDKLIAFMNEAKTNPAPAYNIKGYLYNQMGQLENGIKEIEKYMELYKDGYNPLDSRAEFYLFSKDTAQAILQYEKVSERFPYSLSASNNLRRLKKK